METKTFDVIWRFCYSVEFFNFICEIENSEIPGSFLFDKFLEGGHKTHIYIPGNDGSKYTQQNKKKFRQKKIGSIFGNTPARSSISFIFYRSISHSLVNLMFFVTYRVEISETVDTFWWMRINRGVFCSSTETSLQMYIVYACNIGHFTSVSTFLFSYM